MSFDDLPALRSFECYESCGALPCHAFKPPPETTST